MNGSGNAGYPSTTEGWLRAIHAVRNGAPGTEAWIVVANVPPLYRVQGVVTSRGLAEQLLNGPPPQDWATDEASSRVIWGPITCSALHVMDVFDPLPHNCWTESPTAPTLRNNARSEAINLLDVSNIRLVVSHGGVDTTYTFPDATDAIFLTRGAREMFLYPQYGAFFGIEYMKALMARIGD